ncbi:MAG: hypothetical protein RLZZ385_2754 [Pseudomonadota bacterium]|jgi:uncharacterized membrane protein
MAVWLNGLESSTNLHESYYMYNWVESTHVLTLMVCLGMLFIIDLRMLGFVLPDVSAAKIAERLNIPMLVGFSIMFITGILLFYAVPVRSTQSIWLRIKLVIMVTAGINAWLFHKRMKESASSWENDRVAPRAIRLGAIYSLAAWSIIVICGRFIAYDWFDCEYDQGAFISFVAGCVDGQTHF